jgi:hypothetical protein
MNELDFGFDPQESINMSHYMSRNGNTDLEIPTVGITIDYDADALAAELADRGYENLGIITQTSGMSMIQVKKIERGRVGRRILRRCLGSKSGHRPMMTRMFAM